MPDTFSDRLLAAIDEKRAPICVGIDPILSMLPEELAPEDQGSADAALDALYDFTLKILPVVAPHVPCVKFQSAYFEQYHSDGVEAYFELIQEATDMGLVVIGDIKRGDIGSTASAYAAGHLAQPMVSELDDEFTTPDAVTVNPMLGLDTLQPFIDAAKTHAKGLFVLVRTSNPGSAQLQDVKLADGRTWSEALADALAPLAADPAIVGASGFSSIGAVVGATQPHTMASLRQRLPKSIFLLPGYGTQGATADMTRSAFSSGLHGALVSASRSILYAHRESRYASRFGSNWLKCVEQATLDMKEDIGRVLGK